MHVDLADCVVLHRRAWRETSLIVDVLAREHGRFALVAKGARRPKSRWSGTLEPLARVSLSWRGRGDMPTLADVQPGAPRRLGDNRLLAGLYAAELTLRLCARGDPHPALFDSFATLLEILEQGAPAVVALRFFERDLLAELGYGLDLWHAADTGQAVVAGQAYNLVADVGFETADNETVDAVDGRVLIGLRSGRFELGADVRTARDLMRRALAPHLGDRPLKSVATAHAMQRLGRRSDAVETADAAHRSSEEPRT
ncbi:DNA repair protein RecO [Salinisphaera sp. USBA-960]|uniref:DNA repair protein RecO n=1 Tax=Salinisphaera orenii TaxID=856731 RepID=UPI000DBE07E0|nr:DNA repair protein RecO [Salifodinibacter halophilus]NNC25852.1 DNA repair protein RecO [Salifodinibacter halophilus]